MDEKNIFNQILDADETVVETIKPNKTRVVIIGFIKDVIICTIMVIIGIALIISSYRGVKFEDGTNMSVVPGVITLVVGILALVCSIVSRLVRYSKTWYCYTNKRIIIRTGFIGADYKMLDYSGIAAIDVRVDLLDKILRPNTGHIIFGSSSSPMITTPTNGNNRGYGGYVFIGVNNPYDVYKRIKEYIASTKQSANIK